MRTYFSEIEAGGHVDSVDLVTQSSLQPAAGPDLSVILAMADDGFDGATTSLPLSLGEGDAPLLADDDDFGVLRFDAVLAIAEIDAGFLRFRAGEPISVNEALIAAYQVASSPDRIRALKSDVEAFDAWCRRTSRIALPASAETVADYLDARAGKGGKPASLGRYKASVAKFHQLLDLKDSTSAPLVKLRFAAVRREKGTAQKQARPLRFKGPVRDVERDKACGLNIRALLESCGDDLPELRDRALLSAAYDIGLRASECSHPAGAALLIVSCS